MIIFHLLNMRRLKLKNKIAAILNTVLILFTLNSTAFASNLESVITKSDINKNATVAVSIKDAKSGRTVYEYNSHKLMNPASILKVFTMKSAYNELGSKYLFETELYLDQNNNLYIKPSADPSFTTAGLKILLQTFKDENEKTVINDVIIDPSVIDDSQWGIGWMWDDDTNPLLPKYSPFSINENKIHITISPSKNGRQPEIKNTTPYNMPILSTVKSGNSNAINIERMPWKNGDYTKITGTIKTQKQVILPVNSPQRYFVSVLEQTLKSTGIKYSGGIKIAPVPHKAKKVAHISSQPLELLIANTLKNSNNFYSEMIFKAAGGHYAKTQGTTQNAVEMFKKYYSDVKSDAPIIVDACGISRNDLISADWVTSALNKIYKEKDFSEFAPLLAKPIEGTLSDRLLNISLKLRAKTGTASNISSIAGYIETKAKKKYSFAIMIQNHNQETIKVKQFEDKIINEIYKM